MRQISLRGSPGKRGRFTAVAPEADIPALVRKGAMAALGGQLDLFRCALILRRRGADFPEGG